MERTFLVNFSEEDFKALLKEALRELLIEMLPNAQSLPDVLNVKEAAEYLRMKITTLYEKTSRKLIPHFKKGNKLYFYRDELREWIGAGKVKSSDELQGEAATYLLNKKRN